MKKIAILTGGGDCPGMNAVIRAIVKTAIGNQGWEIIGYKDGYRGLVMNEFVNLKLDDVSGILDEGGTILGTSNIHNPLKFKVEKDGNVEIKDMTERIKNNMEMFGIEGLICIGGDSTIYIAGKLSESGINIICIPKTIDNDIAGTDISSGFSTAVSIVTEAVDRLHTTAESHHRVMIVETMGRFAGWIALEAGIASGADIILIPEINYDINSVAMTVLNRKNKGKSFSIILAAEAAHAKGGEYVTQCDTVSDYDGIKLGGIGNHIACQLEKITGIECKTMVLGYLQRGGRPNAADRILSTRLGAAAVDAAKDDEYGKMISISGNDITRIDLNYVINSTNTIKPDNKLIRIARNIGISFGD